MFWKRFATLLAWLMLASYISAYPSSLGYRSDDDDMDDMIVIGYRTCTKQEALKLEQEVYRDVRFDRPEARNQLGYGIYLSPSPGEYMAVEGNWYVVMYMDKDTFEEMPKVWIPKTINGNEIWESEQAVANYIAQHTKVPEENRNQAFRLAPFSTGATKLQLLIPTAFANGHAGLLKAKASETVEGLPTKEPVDYNKLDNVTGDKEDPGAGGNGGNGDNGGGDKGSDSDDDDDDESDDD